MKEILDYTRVVQFADTDMAGITHFSRILCFVEEAEQCVMRTMGVPALHQDGGFPKAHISVDYRSPLRYLEEVWVRMRLKNVGEKSLTWGFQMGVSERLAAEGEIVTVYIDRTGKSTPIPPEWKKSLMEYMM